MREHDKDVLVCEEVCKPRCYMSVRVLFFRFAIFSFLAHNVCSNSIINIPLRILSSWQRRKSQMRTVPSSEQVANLLSVGEKLKTQQGKNQ